MKALIIDDIHPKAAEILSRHMEVTRMPALNTQQLAEAIGPYDVLMMRVSAKIGKEVLDRAPSLKVVATATTGTDHIDLEYCKLKGVKVVHAAGGNAESVAELTIGMMLCLMRHIPRATYDVKRGIWNRAAYTGRELAGKTLGLVACGRIGARVAEIARSLRMTVLAYDPYASPEQAKAMGVQLVGLDELLQRSDIISIHAPHTPETHNLISFEEIARMKDGSLIINMGRGGVLDEKAAYAGLKSGKLAGVAVDVMEQEPCTSSPLYECENFIITPHIGGQTPEALERMAEIAAGRILQALGIGEEMTA